MLYLSNTNNADSVPNSNSVQEEDSEEYGVDFSWPMHRHQIKEKESPFQNRKQIYEEYMRGCREKYTKPKTICDEYEDGRIEMNLHQPRAMQNYTELGFQKIRTPDKVWKLLLDFWETNGGDKKTPEFWNKGNSYSNHWASPTYMVSVEDSNLRGGGYTLKNSIWEAAKATLEEWTGEELAPCSLYGIRIYTEGAILATHVDRLPLVSSAIVNVAQDVDEPWPIEVIGHDGRAHNITMEPGDMVLYESHSVMHGRPFALKGRYFANVFIHFEPIGHTLRHDPSFQDESNHNGKNDLHEKYKEAIKNGQGGHENNEQHLKLPPYILENTDVAEEWIAEHENGEEGYDDEQGVNESTTGSTVAHIAAQEGNILNLIDVIEANEHLIHSKDSNGWTPLHEGARTGSIDVVKLLVEKGADVNAVTEFGQSVLYLAVGEHGDDHPVVDFLKEFGAIFAGPEL